LHYKTVAAAAEAAVSAAKRKAEEARRQCPKQSYHQLKQG
jgi:hypothetical protein